jgi:hypothetical protein
MSATKQAKQVNDLENAVVILEERIEKMEDEHQLLKQMISMQSTLIDNLQMMVKMSMTPQVVHVGGKDHKDNQDSQNSNHDDKTTNPIINETHLNSPSIKTMKTRMSRVV